MVGIARSMSAKLRKGSIPSRLQPAVMLKWTAAAPPPFLLTTVSNFSVHGLGKGALVPKIVGFQDLVAQKSCGQATSDTDVLNLMSPIKVPRTR